MEAAVPQSQFINDYEWGICWDFEKTGWRPQSRNNAWQPPQWAGSSNPARSSAVPPPPPPSLMPQPGLKGQRPAWTYGVPSRQGVAGPFPVVQPVHMYEFSPEVTGATGRWDQSAKSLDDRPYIGDVTSGRGGGATWSGSKGGWKGSSGGYGRQPAKGSWAASSSWMNNDQSWYAATDPGTNAVGAISSVGGYDGNFSSENPDAQSFGQSTAIDGKRLDSGKGKARGGRGSNVRAQWQPKGEGDGGDAEEAGLVGGWDEAKDEVLAEIEILLGEAGSPLQRADFDFRVRRFLLALRGSGGRKKVSDALAMIRTYTSQKSRQSVKNWSAYLLTLLKKFEPEPNVKSNTRAQALVVPSEKSASERPPAAQANVEASSVVAAPSEAAKSVCELKGNSLEGKHEEREKVQQAETTAPAFTQAMPAGWEAGRQALLEEIGDALASGIGGSKPTCPFTSKPLDYQATLVAHMAACLGSDNSSQNEVSGAAHVMGLARTFSLTDCPRAAAATVAMRQQEFTELASEASAMDAATVATDIARARPETRQIANTLLQEIGLELTAEVLRNSKLGLT